MLHENLILVLILLLGITLLVMLGQKLKIAYPIFLVLAGLIIGFIPGVPSVSIDPNLIFLIFLPPLLYEAAWYTSWKDFWEYKGAIFLLAVGLVIFTSATVAYFSVLLIPGFTLSLGFVLGGIISPPDAVAASAILKKFKIPKISMSLLEGESLVNDATSLIVFKFALATVITGNFVIQDAALNFVVVALGGIVVGLIVGAIFYAIHRWLPKNDNIDVVLTFLTPYFMYIAAEEIHVSGVISVVAGGLLLSSQSLVILTPSSRVKTFSTWGGITFILNGIVFILIGLGLPEIVSGMKNRYSILEATCYGGLISLLTVVIRYIWFDTTRLIAFWVNKQSRIRYQHTTWKGRLIVILGGMRGVVSLAAALSIPIMISDTVEFPLRNLILFITFIVIFFTLVVQGLLLPIIVKRLHINETNYDLSEEEQVSKIRMQLVETAIKKLEKDYFSQCKSNVILGNYKEELEHTLYDQKKRLDILKTGALDVKGLNAFNSVMLDIINAQRKTLHHLKNDKQIDSELITSEEWQLDLDEMRINSFLSDINKSKT